MPVEVSKDISKQMMAEKVAVVGTTKVIAEEPVKLGKRAIRVAKREEKEKMRKIEDEAAAKALEPVAPVAPVAAVKETVATVPKKKKAPKPKKKKAPKPAKEVEEMPDNHVGKDKATEFLSIWKNDRPSWKFQKIRQSWVLKHIFNAEQIDEAFYAIALEYVADLRGNTAILNTLAAAEKIMADYKTQEEKEFVPEAPVAELIEEAAEEVKEGETAEEKVEEVKEVKKIVISKETNERAQSVAKIMKAYKPTTASSK